ncbi:MAG: hypothetical protein IKC72_06910 [Clostridia bacterium]|nr:hypothetical protein [Clostridia bacterium]
MAKWKLVMSWHYSYLKEGTWDDDETGVKEFILEAGAVYGVPSIEHRKSIEILSFEETDGVAQATIRIDSHTYALKSDEDEVTGSCGYEYSVCGDHVSVTVSFTMKIVQG